MSTLGLKLSINLPWPWTSDLSPSRCPFLPERVARRLLWLRRSQEPPDRISFMLIRAHSRGQGLSSLPPTSAPRKEARRSPQPMTAARMFSRNLRVNRWPMQTAQRRTIGSVAGPRRRRLGRASCNLERLEELGAVALGRLDCHRNSRPRPLDTDQYRHQGRQREQRTESEHGVEGVHHSGCMRG